jgi:glycosyltransferase involved in cell wall biosynthesis
MGDLQQGQSSSLISIVIPAHNAGQTLGACLDALAAQNSPHPLEVIVVNDGSTDGTEEVARAKGAKVLSQPHSNPAVARNLGAQEARGDILLFLDADCAPLEDWVERMIAPLRNEHIAGVKGAYLTQQKGLLPRFVQAEFEGKYDRMKKEEYIDFIDTYSAGYRRVVFLDLGGFDPSFPACSAEDAEFSFRVSERGYKMVFAPEARVYHYHPDRLWDYLWRKFRYGYWRARVYYRHPAKLVRDSYTPREMKIQLGLAAASLIALALSFANPLFWWALLALLLAYFWTTIPFLRKASQGGWAVGALSPTLLYLRSLAQGLGLLAGSLLTLGQMLRPRLGAGRPSARS